MTQHQMSGQRKKDLAKESKKHESVGKKDKQGRLLSSKFKEERVSIVRECQMLQTGQLITDDGVTTGNEESLVTMSKTA